MNGIKNRIEDRHDAALGGGFRRAQERVEIAMACRYQHRGGPCFDGDVEGRLVETEQELRTRHSSRAQLVAVRGIDAHHKFLCAQSMNSIAQMRERRIRKTSQVDHVSSRGAHRPCTIHYGLNAKRGGIDDLGEYTDVVARKIQIAPPFSEISGKVLQIIWPTLERNAEFRTQAVEVCAASPGHHDAARIQRAGNAALDDPFRHQRRNLDPDIKNRPAETRVLHAAKDLLQPWLGQVASQEGDTFGHASSRLRRESASRSPCRFSTTFTSLNDFSRAVFSRSIWRG